MTDKQINSFVSDNETRDILNHLSEQTLVNKSALIRKALRNLLEQFNKEGKI